MYSVESLTQALYSIRAVSPQPRFLHKYPHGEEDWGLFAPLFIPPSPPAPMFLKMLNLMPILYRVNSLPWHGQQFWLNDISAKWREILLESDNIWHRDICRRAIRSLKTLAIQSRDCCLSIAVLPADPDLFLLTNPDPGIHSVWVRIQLHICQLPNFSYRYF